MIISHHKIIFEQHISFWAQTVLGTRHRLGARRIVGAPTHKAYVRAGSALAASAALIGSLLSATPAQAQFGFGSAVAVGEDEVFIGEPGNKITPGFVYVYRADDGDWMETSVLARADATDGDGFGQAIVVNGETLLVSATETASGAVIVFRKQGSRWNEVGRFSPTNGLEGDRFGGVMAASGELVLAGAAGRNDNTGSAYVFRRQQDSWTEIAELIPDAGGEPIEDEEGDVSATRPARFGAAVAIAGEWAMIGAPEENGSGSVYVYRNEGDGWNQFAKLPSEAAEEDADFGSTITLWQDKALIAATGANRVGAVHLYQFDDETRRWAVEATLTPFDGTPDSMFGASIVVDDTELLVGAPGADRSQGRIYRFGRNNDGHWTSVTKIATSGLGRRTNFASSLAKRGDLLVAGIPGDDYGAGTAAIMSRSHGGWDRTKVFSSATGLDPMTDGRVDCTDGMAGIFPCDEIDLISFLPVHAMGGGRGAWTNDVWGWTDPETGLDYALVGLVDRTSFVDVTDPYQPVYVGTLPKTVGSPGSVWRDIKVHADHAFIVSDAAEEHGVQIFDLTHLREFDGVPIEFASDAHYDRINSAHNIVIDEATAFAYVVGASGGGETCGGGLHMINIEDPREPMFAGCFADVSTGRRKTGYSHDAQCVIYQGPDEGFVGRELCFGSNETAISIADVSDKKNPVALSMATYPNVAYTHQGWLTEDHRYFYMNDEGDEVAGTVGGTRTLIFDVQELDDPILVGEYIHDVESIDHNLYIVGNRMYQSNYDAGLRVLDISDPEDPKLTGFFDTVPWGDNKAEGFVSFSWSNYPFFKGGHVLVTSTREGLFIVKERGDGTTAASPGSTPED